MRRPLLHPSRPGRPVNRLCTIRKRNVFADRNPRGFDGGQRSFFPSGAHNRSSRSNPVVGPSTGTHTGIVDVSSRLRPSPDLPRHLHLHPVTPVTVLPRRSKDGGSYTTRDPVPTGPSRSCHPLSFTGTVTVVRGVRGGSSCSRRDETKPLSRPEGPFHRRTGLRWTGKVLVARGTPVFIEWGPVNESSCHPTGRGSPTRVHLSWLHLSDSG